MNNETQQPNEKTLISNTGRKDCEIRDIIAEKIMGELTKNPRQKAKKLAVSLNIDKHLINSILYNELAPYCIQDDDYKWSIRHRYAE